MRTLWQFDHAILPKLITLKAMMMFTAAGISIIAVTAFNIEVELNKLIMSLALGFSLCLLWWLRLALRFPVSDIEILLLLASDMLVLFILIAVSGGSQNPFTSSLLIPLALSVALLKKRFSLILVLVAIAIYAYWTFAGQHEGHAGHEAFSLHLYGMWINFLISAILLYIFIAYAMESIKDREKQLLKAREKILNDEKVVTIATVTASTSHSLGSPLSTMAILLEEAEQEGRLEQDEIALLQQQIQRCKQYLSQIAETSRTLQEGEQEIKKVQDCINDLKQHFQVLSPAHKIQYAVAENLEEIRLKFSMSLFMAIVNLVDNAIEAAQSTVILQVEKHDTSSIAIKVLDDGPGIAEEIQANLGRAFVSTKKEGWGLGVYLANTTIEQFGGSITMQNRPQAQGTLTTITLPIAAV